MPYLIGIDEAGYGPNLGPLVISASAWHVEDEPATVDLYERLGDVVRDASSVRGDSDDQRLAIADSKQLYKPGGGLESLERGVFVALGLLGNEPRTWRAVWECLAHDSGAPRQQLPWYSEFDNDVPLAQHEDGFSASIKKMRGGLADADVALVALRSVAIFPEQFNALTSQLGTKGAVLTRLTLELLSEVLDITGDHPSLVICDKHGGRNRYAVQLQHHFPDYLIEIHGESRQQSVYRWGPPGERTEIQFQAKGERFLPAALASMASKYLRELAMHALNDFWCERVDRLRPTAGYPVDARRFKKEISDTQRELNIEDGVLWRSR